MGALGDKQRRHHHTRRRALNSVSKLLHEAGEALYGPRWQLELARALDVSGRSMRRWAAGTTDVPSGLYIDLLRLTQARAQKLDDLAERLKRA